MCVLIIKCSDKYSCGLSARPGGASDEVLGPNRVRDALVLKQPHDDHLSQMQTSRVPCTFHAGQIRRHNGV